jgi:hypothetical protein
MVISILEEEITMLSRNVGFHTFNDGERQQRNANDELFGDRNKKKRWSLS